MHADRVEVSWDTAKSNWLVRIMTGEEVIRRHCKVPKDADERTLRSVAKKTVQEVRLRARCRAQHAPLDALDPHGNQETSGSGHVGRVPAGDTGAYGR